MATDAHRLPRNDSNELERLVSTGHVRPPAASRVDLTTIERVEGTSSSEVLNELRGDR